MTATREAIELKKHGLVVPPELMHAVVTDVVDGTAPDEQLASLLMAIFIRGLDHDETLALTHAMAGSGVRLSFPGCVDKHSTGGVGDKVSLCALPIVAAAGVPVAKLAGRALGAAGGTIDKLEAIPGLTCALHPERMHRQVERIGLAIAEATDAAPADRRLYAIRDTTGTVDSIPLIAASVVSKKVATGADAVLYDVKCGTGAFMTTAAAARELADLLVELTEGLGIRATAEVTPMNEPLGRMVGNALEVREAIRFLSGEPVPADLDTLARHVAARLLELADVEDAADRVDAALTSGAALERLEAMVAAQGGTLDHLPSSAERWTVHADRDGVVRTVDAQRVGTAVLALGGGRQRKGDHVRHEVGVELEAKAGDQIAAGDPLVIVHGRETDGARALLAGAYLVI